VSFYSRIIRPILFRTDPEIIHYRVFRWLKFFFRLPCSRIFARLFLGSQDPRLHRKVFGIDFPNPVGLAAGLDKDAKLINELSALGFGFIEVGTVTPRPQPGNTKPRMFRLTDDAAIINRMGFNNDGVDAMAARLKNRDRRIIIGGNIGKNKDTSNEDALDDYATCFKKLFPFVDYFAVNVSSPNTPGLRTLQDKEPLLKLLNTLQSLNDAYVAQGLRRKPVLLKIAPDLSNEQLDEIIEVVLLSKTDGVIATNTTVSREGLQSPGKLVAGAGEGGLSGRPLSSRSTGVIRYLSQRSQKKFSIVGVGGIHSPADAIEKLNAGADLIQLYTGFIYEGPGLIRQINKAVLKGETSS
jgi:dihydroorotate dehydrogenase